MAAMAGFHVQLFDVSEEGLKKGIDFIQTQLKKGVEKAKWDDAFVSKTMGFIIAHTKIEDLKEADLIIEAATENKKIKFEIFKNLDQVAKPQALLATNTSSISITEIAAVTKRPGKIAGMHFI